MYSGVKFRLLTCCAKSASLSTPTFSPPLGASLSSSLCSRSSTMIVTCPLKASFILSSCLSKYQLVLQRRDVLARTDPRYAHCCISTRSPRKAPRAHQDHNISGLRVRTLLQQVKRQIASHSHLVCQQDLCEGGGSHLMFIALARPIITSLGFSMAMITAGQPDPEQQYLVLTGSRHFSPSPVHPDTPIPLRDFAVLGTRCSFRSASIVTW